MAVLRDISTFERMRPGVEACVIPVTESRDRHPMHKPVPFSLSPVLSRCLKWGCSLQSVFGIFRSQRALLAGRESEIILFHSLTSAPPSARLPVMPPVPASTSTEAASSACCCSPGAAAGSAAVGASLPAWSMLPRRLSMS